MMKMAGLTRQAKLIVVVLLSFSCWRVNAQVVVGFTLNGVSYPNHGIVTISEIGTGSAALNCTTTLPECCYSRQGGGWFLPNGDEVLRAESPPYYRARARDPGTLLLNRNPVATTTGIFRCDVPVTDGSPGDTQSLYVGIYTSTTGQVTISGGINFQLDSEPNANPPVFTLTCTSTGGPATDVSWMRGSTTLSGTSLTVTNTVIGTYENILRVTGRQVGSYMCSVSNSRTSPPATTTLLVEAAGQPGNLGAMLTDPTSIRVTWTAPTSGATVTGYQIYWSGGSDQGSMDASAGDTAVTITISGLARGLVYTITIVARSNQLPSQTNMATVTLAPSPPTITMANVLSPTSVALTWTPVTGEVVNGYEIMFSYQGPCSGITLTNTTTVGAGIMSHTQTGLQEFSNYIVSVAAVNSGGLGTQTQMVTTTSSAPSGPPQMVTATATGTTIISVRWDRVDCLQRNSDITGYVVSYGRRGNGDNETRTVIGTTDRTYTVMGLNASTEYFVMVAAMNSDGVTGPFSNPVSTETLGPPTAPTVTPGASTPTSVVVSWSQQAGVDSYEISFQRATGNQQRGECTSLEHSGTVSVDGSITTHNLTGLQEFSTYFITVTAMNGAGRNRSDPLRVSTQMAAPSSAPEMLRKVETSITIAWDAVNCIERNSNITGYVVRFIPPSNSGNDSVMVSGTGDAGGMVTIHGLTPSTQYSIQVAAVNSDGSVGVFSTALSVQTALVTTQALDYASLVGAVVGTFIGTALLYTVVLLVVNFIRNRRHREVQNRGDDTKGTQFKEVQNQGDDTKGTHFENDIVMKECIAYGGVAVHSSPEDGDYEETPQ